MSGDHDFIADVLQECFACPGNNLAAVDRVLAKHRASRAIREALGRLLVIQGKLAEIERRRRNLRAAIGESTDKRVRELLQADLTGFLDRAEALKEQEREAVQEISQLSR